MLSVKRIIIAVIACLPILCMFIVMDITANQLAEYAVFGVTGLASLVKAFN